MAIPYPDPSTFQTNLNVPEDLVSDPLQWSFWQRADRISDLFDIVIAQRPNAQSLNPFLPARIPNFPSRYPRRRKRGKQGKNWH